MDLIQKIVKSRITLKEILSKDYNTDDLPIYSVDEMDKLYKLQPDNESPLKILGDNGLPCHFTVKHRILDEHELHVYYYNFPKIGENTTKINRTITNKLNTLYEDKIIKETDSIFGGKAGLKYNEYIHPIEPAAIVKRIIQSFELRRVRTISIKLNSISD